MEISDRIRNQETVADWGILANVVLAWRLIEREIFCNFGDLTNSVRY